MWLTTQQVAEILGIPLNRVRSIMIVGTKVNGRTIKLRCRVIGDRYQTCQEWIDDYIRENTEARLGCRPKMETPTQATRRAEKAKARVQSKHKLTERK
jgi:hypothetical protein